MKNPFINLDDLVLWVFTTISTYVFKAFNSLQTVLDMVDITSNNFAVRLTIHAGICLAATLIASGITSVIAGNSSEKNFVRAFAQKVNNFFVRIVKIGPKPAVATSLILLGVVHLFFVWVLLDLVFYEIITFGANFNLPRAITQILIAIIAVVTRVALDIFLKRSNIRVLK